MIWSTSNIPCSGNPCSCTKVKKNRDDKINSVLGVDNSKPYYKNNHNIRAANIEFEYTDLELKSFKRSYSDINYFATLSNSHIKDYQKKILDDIYNKKFNIILDSKQSGTSYLISLSILQCVLKCDKNILITSNNGESSSEILNNIKNIYQKLPFYLKPGVISWRTNSIKFDNGSSIECSGSNRFSFSRSYDYVFMDNFAYYTKNNVNFIYSSIIPIIKSRMKSKLIICSTPNGDNHFKNLFESTNIFNKNTIHWSDIPERDNKWKDEMIKYVGGIESFAQYYENIFIGSKEWNRYINLHKLT